MVSLQVQCVLIFTFSQARIFVLETKLSLSKVELPEPSREKTTVLKQKMGQEVSHDQDDDWGDVELDDELLPM